MKEYHYNIYSNWTVSNEGCFSYFCRENADRNLATGEYWGFRYRIVCRLKAKG